VNEVAVSFQLTQWFYYYFTVVYH